MSAALKPKRVDSEEEQDDRIEYIEVKASSQIRAILKAEQEITKQQPLPNLTPSAPLPQEQKQKDRKFIKDDRQREYPQRKEEKKQDPQFSEPARNEKPSKTSKEEPKKSKKEAPIKTKNDKYYSGQIDKSQRNQKRGKESEGDKRIIYVQKDQIKEYQNDRQRYTDKKGKEVRYKEKIRKQIQIKSGEEVELEVINKQEEYENQIYIGDKKSVEDYLLLAKKLLKKYDFIILKAIAGLVTKAFLIVGLLAQDLPNLKQINIPSTTKVKEVRKGQEERIRTRGAISIELSLHDLQKDHIGYQQAKPQKSEKSESTSNYKQKQGDKYREKQGDKYREKDDRKYKEKQEEEKYWQKDERKYKQKEGGRFKEKEKKYMQVDERALR